MNAARFRDVTLRGGDARPISLDVPSGAVVTLEGTDAPDGILSVLAAMAPSASGLVELLGEDVSGFDAAQLARFRRGRIALVGAQAVACDPRRSLLENLAVAAGEEIGTVGDTGSLSGAGLYFENGVFNNILFDRPPRLAKGLFFATSSSCPATICGPMPETSRKPRRISARVCQR